MAAAFIGASAVIGPSLATTVSPTKSCTAGNLVVAILGTNGNNDFGTTSPPANWVQGPTSNASTGVRVELWYLPGTSNAGGTINPTWTVTSSQASGFIAEFSGIVTTSPLDVSSSASIITTQTTTGPTPTLAGSTVGDLIVTGFCELTGSAALTFSVTSGTSYLRMTDNHAVVKTTHIVGDYKLSGTATDAEQETSTVTCSVNGWAGVIASFKIAPIVPPPAEAYRHLTAVGRASLW